MLKRPKVDETEEDLIKQQEEFLKASGKQTTIKKRSEEIGAETTKSFALLGEIKEKTPGVFKPVELKSGQKGFPKLFSIDLTLAEKKKGKKSLFAMQLDKNRGREVETEDSEVVEEKQINKPDLIEQEGIHEENLKTLSTMSEDEILQKQRKLLNTLDPKIVEYLKRREKNSEGTDEKKEINDTKEVNEEEVRRNVEKNLDNKWVNLDFLEKEKLEWIGDIPDKKSLEPDQPYSARFDFNGELQPFTREIDVRNSLYHHGEEPDRPGYTIQELYQLSRSQVLQQRILALNTLSNIIRKTKLGYYDSCFEGQLLHSLVESDLFLLLRFSLDEHSLIPASVYCLYNLLCNRSDEYCLDRLLGLEPLDEEPLLYVNLTVNKSEQKELKDHTLIACDMIRGALRTDLLPRLAYVLRNFSTHREVIVRVVKILTRIARHSEKAAKRIIQAGLLPLVYNYFEFTVPIYEGVKLFRVLAAHSKKMASEIACYLRYFLGFLFVDEHEEISGKELYLLKLEALHLWRELLRFDLLKSEFCSWSQPLMQILSVYVEEFKLGIVCYLEFDLELYAAIVSLYNVSIYKGIRPQKELIVLMRTFLLKWMTLLSESDKYNFALSKALGCTFRFFSFFFNDEVHCMDTVLFSKVFYLLLTLPQEPIFANMTANLINSSYIHNPSCVTRDPDNLPSLCTIYENGEDFLSIVRNTSPFPFLSSLVEYLTTLYSHANYFPAKNLLKNPDICKYLSNLKLVPYNWFMKFETNFLVRILEMMIYTKDDRLLKLCFAILPLLRVDDGRARRVFEIVFNLNYWRYTHTSSVSLEGLDWLYAKYLLRPFSRSHKQDLIPRDWPYKILSLLRGTQDVSLNKNVLKFLTFLNDCADVPTKVPYTYRFYHLCSVFLTDSNVVEEEIQKALEKLLSDLITNRHKINLDLKYDKKKSFYDLYTELITQYAGVSYGLPVFAKYVLLPLQNRNGASFRKLLWFEYIHVLRVITLPYPVDAFVGIRDFVEPCETDESLLVAYLNSVSNGIITKKRNPFVYQIAVGNVKRFLDGENQNEKLLSFLKQKVAGLRDEEIKNDILSFDVNS